MTSYLLDSDVLMDFFKKKKGIVDLFVELEKKGELDTSILSVTELRSGWTSKEAGFLLPRLYKLVNIYEITREIAELAGKFRQEYKLKGFLLPVVDTLIASTSIIAGSELVTRNKKDFPMPEITFYEFKI